MRSLRAIWRLAALSVLTGATVLLMVGLRALGWIAPKMADRLERRAARRWARTLAWVLGLSVRCDGTPPSGRYLLIANHLSYMDILTLMCVVDARFLSKAEVADWPLIGPVARFAGTLFVDRTRRTDLPRVIDEIDRSLGSGRGVAFFPEGTSTAGFEVLPFRPSLFEVASRGRLEVACAALHYRTAPGDPPAEWSVCWWGDAGFLEHFWPLLRLSRYEAEVRFSDARLWSADRKQLAEEARSEVLRLFRPVCDEDPSLRETSA
jgi:1-acyl-sn-glycerol-3-phosphate acyltransferase